MKNTNFSRITFVISLISLGISIAVLVNYCPTQNLKFDYMGVIVGILSLLVTILIGLQLYNYIYARESITRIIDEMLRKMALDFQHTTAARDKLLNGFELVVATYNCPKITEGIISALKEIMNCDNADMRENTLDYIMEEAHKLCTVYSVNGKFIKPNKRVEYLYVVKKIDHKYASELMEYIKVAIEMPS